MRTPRLRIRNEEGPPFPLDERALRELISTTSQPAHVAIDLLREVKGVGGYQECKAEREPVEVEGVRFDVLNLAARIRAKRAAGRRKDEEVVLELEALAELGVQRVRAPIAADRIDTGPPLTLPSDLEEDLALLARIRRLQFEQVRHVHDPARTREISAELAALPPLLDVARRIVHATRQRERLAARTPEQLATVREARAVFGVRGSAS